MSFTQTKPDQLFPFLTIPADLGVFTASQFFTWRRYLYAEHRCLYKEIAHKHKRLHNFDRQINQCKQTKDHRQMGELIEKRKKVHDELKDLDWQIYACNKSLETIKTIVDDGIVPYSRSWCMAFTTHMLQALPREVVDLVYDWIVDSDVISSVGHQVLQQVEYSCCVNQTCRSSIPHFLDPDFIPSQMSTEILSLIAQRYAASHSELVAFRTKESITSLVTTRALHLDVPASSFFCNLYIQLHLLSLTEQYRMNSRNCKASVEDPELHQHLRDLLLAITPSKATRLTLDIVYPKKRYRDPLFPGLENAVKTLEGGAWKGIEVNWRDNPSWPIFGWEPNWETSYCEVHDHFYKLKLHWCEVVDDQVVVKPWR